MGFISTLSKIFGTKQDRDMKRLRPILEKVNAAWESIKSLSDDELRGKTDEFKGRVASGETLDSLLPEAFAVVREATHRVLGERKVFVDKITGKEIRFMGHFDVQVIAAIVLHQGGIAEMKTGEGKTQVGPMAAYLNALSGKGVHVITVNDYLAKRDSEWMGQIFNFLGLTVGCLDKTDAGSFARRDAYACDITYGTNNEFGFDYLRDNMAVDKDNCVMRELNFCIIDEVDNILIDEARTPLIISGPSNKSNREYDDLNPSIRRLVGAQKKKIQELVDQIKPLVEKEAYDFDFGKLMLVLQKGDPKNQFFLDTVKLPGVAKAMKTVEATYLQEKKLHELCDDLYYSIDESGHSAEMTDKGRVYIGGEDDQFFVIPDLSIQIGKINNDATLSADEKNLARELAHREYAERSERIHCVGQLLRAFALFDKDVNYVVKDGQVLIVDEFTGRVMHGRRYSDGLHQALEAKEGVKIAGESQTLATITFQNFFKMYTKMSGMTGTAVTEEKEFLDIYTLPVVQIVTNRPVARLDWDDEIYKTQREKYNAVVDEIKKINATGQPILVGTVSIEKSEYISQLLTKVGVAHEVLNAKNHAREATIIAQAGKKNGVTIATNMAGRGTDIKLGGNFEEMAHTLLIKDGENPDDFSMEEMVKRYPALYEQIEKEKAEVLELGGLCVIGTERHESRRIDNQLRGRSGRQGDKGSSRFYLSLDDDLMRIFGSERIAGIMERLGAEEGEVISHPLVSGAISNAQRRVEGRNYEIRKHLKEYDDVMNLQRTEIYGLRQQILRNDDVHPLIRDQFAGALEDTVMTHCGGNPDTWDIDAMEISLGSTYGLVLDRSKYQFGKISREELFDLLWKDIIEFYAAKEARVGSEQMRHLERSAFLLVIDDLWKQHLYEMDHVKDGVQYRSFGQKNPLFEYQKEGLKLFESLRSSIAQKIASILFRFEIVEEPRPVQRVVERHDSVWGNEEPQSVGTVVREDGKVGRNDPCPCGSGKKYKKCHGSTDA